MRAKIRDTEIYFDVEGSGLVVDGDRMREKPVAFLVHGGPGADHTGFKPLFSRLSDRLQLVYFDHRGQGRSARGDRSTYTLDNNVEDMEALRQHLGLGPIVVIGGSYGGMVALTYASRYPQHVSHLIVMVTVPDFRFLEKAKQNVAERGTAEQKAIAQTLWEGTFRDEEHLREYFQITRTLYSITAKEEDPIPKSWNRAILSADAINEAFGGFLRTYDVRSQLPQITAPTLVIAGKHDWICPPEFSEEIADLIPNSDLRIFENSGHAVRADEPEALLDVIAGFIVYKK
ncbi:MAG TPA: alpha/beta fold hydrolase [Leptolyngbyaceae cyanobacterium M33_DOE_097]|uniref:Alpha/beta fold hydrolase n=1 Tax=Oscillatoriales cyanobacterium SpSt-418 TaxID=2282169 RepID=A0A7C3PD76_9CYAN|nr:alpha/beta fold hydrolase [Leptolyngbyaceae cyanobacterium M33_DOE_097]